MGDRRLRSRRRSGVERRQRVLFLLLREQDNTQYHVSVGGITHAAFAQSAAQRRFGLRELAVAVVGLAELDVLLAISFGGSFALKGGQRPRVGRGLAACLTE